MKRLISIIMLITIALMFSGCVIVDASYYPGHRHYSGIVVADYPPPPPPRPVYVVRPLPPPPPPVVVIRPAPVPHHNSGPGRAPEGRRDLRR